ncbi:MAG: hypothetical protein QNK42_14480, partial [Pseudodonghicola sp.]|nr:hypothetical protein [Pseudodonghicola sp.]
KTTGQYQFAIDGARNWQLRLQGEYTHNRRHDMEVFDRIRAGVLLRYRHDPKRLTRARLRLGYREQNDALFAGFDQAEYLLEVGHDWRPKADRTNLSVTAYKELRRNHPAWTADGSTSQVVPLGALGLRGRGAHFFASR